jgi:hypothetical protein
VVANLPARCKLEIYTLSGDIILEVNFDIPYQAPARAASSIRPRATRAGLSRNVVRRDLITREGQACATGLYMFAVEDHATA